MRYKTDPETGKKIRQYVDGRFFNSDDIKDIGKALLLSALAIGTKILSSKSKKK